MWVRDDGIESGVVLGWVGASSSDGLYSEEDQVARTEPANQVEQEL